MPEAGHTKRRLFVIKKFGNSSIIRVCLLLLLFWIYLLTISPKIEGYITENFASFARENSTEEINSLTPVFDIHVYAGEYNLSGSLDSGKLSSRTKFTTLDPRVLAMSKFLTDYQSPMANSAEVFIEQADLYGLDWRLVASISGVESAFGNLIPKGTNNGWGWRGVNSNEAGWSSFSSWEEAISHITERLALGYGTDLTPFDIQDTYCPPCGATGEDLWAKGVIRFMNELQYYVDNLENL